MNTIYLEAKMTVDENNQFSLTITYPDTAGNAKVVVSITKEKAQEIYARSPEVVIDIDCRRLPKILFSKEEREAIYRRYNR